MACLNPSLAVDLGIYDGKHKISFLRLKMADNLLNLRETYGDSLLMLPCGKCIGCKCDKAKDWATRCYCESLYHDESVFITLTYDDEHYPGKLVKSHITDFFTKLYNRGFKFRYFGCGEYGSNTHRAHYHIILFGFHPHDLEPISKIKDGFLYQSKFLASIWAKGFVSVGEVNFRTAGYVARYTTKKLADDDSWLFMSNKPGIGYQYFLDHYEKLLDDGCIYGDFGDMKFAPIPIYFEKKLREIYPDRFEAYKIKKLERAKLDDNSWQNFLKFGHLEEVKAYRAEILADKLLRIRRK